MFSDRCRAAEIGCSRVRFDSSPSRPPAEHGNTNRHPCSRDDYNNCDNLDHSGYDVVNVCRICPRTA